MNFKYLIPLMFLIILAIPVYSTATVGRWDLNETTGLLAYDYNKLNDLEITNATINQTGLGAVSPTSFYFDANDYLLKTSPTVEMAPASAFTINAYVKLVSVGTQTNTILSNRPNNSCGTAYGYSFAINTDANQLNQRLAVMINYGAGSNKWFDSPFYDFDIDTVYMVSVKWDKTANSGKPEFFINGTSIGSATTGQTNSINYDGSYGHILAGGGTCYIGSSLSTAYAYATTLGYLSDIRIYGSAIDDSEIFDLYTSETTGIVNLTNPQSILYTNNSYDFNGSFLDSDYTTLNNPAWNISKSTFLRTLSIAAKEATPNGLFFKPDGKEMYIVGNASDNVYQYSLSTDWDISSATFTRSFSVAVEGITSSLFFSPTGNKMYILGTSLDRVIQYNLSTDWDISSAVYDQNILISAKESAASGLAFDSTGTYMYITGPTSDAVHQYTLGTPYAVATAVFTRTLNIIEKTTNVTDVTFDYNGTRMYITESDTDDIYQYNLSTAWNIATALYDQNFSVTAKETIPTATYFNPNGSGFYVLGSTSDSVHQYNTENIVNYKYSFGYNTTDAFDGSETYIDTNQTLDYAQTDIKYFNLNHTFLDTDIGTGYYSFFKVLRYFNNDYNSDFNGWSISTFDVEKAEVILNIYDENTLLPISTVRITDSNGTTYDTNATGYINLGQLSGDKSFTISKTGYDSRKLDFFFKVSDYYNWNFALTQDGNSVSIGFIVKDSNDNLWSNKYLMFVNDTNIITSVLTSATGTATANILPAGDYNALLYNATGDLNYTYTKSTITVNKPKNEKTSALISPYDIYVSGLLQYSLTNQTDSSATFNVFAGTTDFYTFTAVDYNAVVADQKYIPKSYFVQVPMGNSYVNAITYQPYLLLKTDGIVPKVVVLDQLNRTIENAQIYVSKYVGDILTVVESGYTFSNGAFNFSAYPLDVYYLTVYYNGTDYGTFSVQPRESSDIFYIKIDRTTAEDIAQALIIQTNLDDTSRYQNRDTNINVLGTITSNFNYITDYNVNVYERGNLVYSSNTVATGLSIDINKFVDVNLIPDYVHSAVIKIIVNYSIAGVTGSQTFSKNIMITDSPDVIGTIEDAQTEIGQPLSIFIALAVAIMLIAVLIFSGILTDPAILAVFGALVIGVFMMLGFLDIGVVVLGMDIGRFAYFLGLMATLYFALFGGR